MRTWSIIRLLSLSLLISALLNYGVLQLLNYKAEPKMRAGVTKLSEFFVTSFATSNEILFQLKVQNALKLKEQLKEIPYEFWFIRKGNRSFASTEKSVSPTISEKDYPQEILKPTLYRLNRWQWLTLTKIEGSVPTWIALQIGPDNFQNAFFIKWALIFAGFILLNSCAATFLILYVQFKTKSQEAKKVITDLAGGNLKARMKVSKYEEGAEMMSAFNEMANKVEELVSNLKVSEATRKQLIGELSHDLRTPLTAVKLALESLQDHGEQLGLENRDKLIEIAQKELSFMQRLIQFMFSLAKANHPLLEIRLKTVDLNSLITEELKTRTGLETGQTEKRLWKLKNVTDEVSIKADQEMLMRLVRNLLDNARKYSRTNIEVELKTTPSHAILSIKDDGPGLKTDPFNQPAPNRLQNISAELATQPETSLGLGSAIVKAALELHEWTLEVEPTDEGTHIEVCFPLKKEITLKFAA